MPAKPRAPGERPDQTREPPTGDPPAGPLVPVYGVPGIAPGVQAFRRGGMILYTVRGEPKEVQDLMGRLGEKGVGEVVALISHSAEESPARGEEGPEPGDDGQTDG